MSLNDYPRPKATPYVFVTLADKVNQPTFGRLGAKAQELADSVGLDLLHKEVDDGRGVGINEALTLRTNGVREQAAHLLQGALYGQLTCHATHTLQVVSRSVI